MRLSGQAVAAARKARGWTQRELAQKVSILARREGLDRGLHRATLITIERGTHPFFWIAGQLLDLLGLEVVARNPKQENEDAPDES